MFKIVLGIARIAEDMVFITLLVIDLRDKFNKKAC